MKKFLAMLLAALMVLSVVACNNPTQSSQAPAQSTADGQTEQGKTEEGKTEEGKTDPAKPEIEKPAEVSVIVNGTWPDAAGGALDAFVSQMEELTGVKIKLTKPDHSSYDDVLQQVISGGEWPDVIYTCEPYYSAWASQGVFWDMTEAFESSDIYTRAEAYGTLDAFKSEYLNGVMYGLPVKRGNGAVTYIKKQWLDNCGIEKAPTNWAEFSDMLDKFHNMDPDGNGVNGDTYGTCAAGFIQTEPPYIMYLPEFWQQAYPYFYQKEDGTWVDGWEEDICKEALGRIREGVVKGWIDPTTLDNATKDCRNKFWDNGAGSFGSFTYWACNWASKLRIGFVSNNQPSELIALEPIEEVGKYIDRVSYVWCISSKCKNPEGVWKYFLEPILDGGDVQFLWTYGPKGVYWSDEAETVLDQEYKAGEFHMRENLSSPGQAYVNCHIDPLGQLVPLANDPLEQIVDPVAYDCMLMFNANSKGAAITPPTEEVTEYNADLVIFKNQMIAQIATGQISIEDAYKKYVDEGYADNSKAIVESLNK